MDTKTTFIFKEGYVLVRKELRNEDGERVVIQEKRRRTGNDDIDLAEDAIPTSPEVGPLLDLSIPTTTTASQDLEDLLGGGERKEQRYDMLPGMLIDLDDLETTTDAEKETDTETDGPEDEPEQEDLTKTTTDNGNTDEPGQWMSLDFLEDDGLIVVDEYIRDEDDDSDADSVVTIVEARTPKPDLDLIFQGSDLSDEESDSETLVVDDATSAGESPQVPVTTKKMHYCLLCDAEVEQRLRRHIEEQHVPWWLSPNRACWTCQETQQSATFTQYTHRECDHVFMTDADIQTWVKLATGLLEVLAESLGCSSFESLLDLIIANGWYPRPSQPTRLSLQQRLFMWLWEKETRRPLTPFGELTISPPRSVSCLLHYKVLLEILPHVTQETQELVRRGTPSAQLGVRRSLRRVTLTSDAHCHLDRDADLRAYEGSKWDAPLRIDKLIANFVFPNRWDSFETWMDSNPRVYGTVGIHPSQPKIQDSQHRRLQELLRHPRCVALGEVGLDYVRGPAPSQRKAQRLNLELQLQAKPQDLPVVLHCRSCQDNNAYLDALDVLRTTTFPTTPVMLHCFMGSSTDRDRILEDYKRAVFSFSPKALDRVDFMTPVLRGLRLDQILLETDYPYLSRAPRPDLYRLAEWVGIVKGVCPAIVLEANRRNVALLFGLPLVD